MKIKFVLNNKTVETDIHPAKSLLDFLRHEERLTGPKEVCKEGDCGACAVLLGEIRDGKLRYKSVASCIYPVGKVNGKHVVTVEGLNEPKLNFVQRHFALEGAAQCGFCTPGYISSLASYFLTNAEYNETTAIMAISGNICRCTGYGSIKRAVKNMVAEFQRSATDGDERIKVLVEKNVIPKYFTGIKEKLQSLNAEKIDTDGSGRIIAGGTDLLVQIPEKLLEENVRLIERNGDGEVIHEKENKIVFDAETTFAEFSESEILKKYFPNFDAAAKLIASPLIRNTATIGGNIVNASPIGDFSIILLALDAELTISDGKNERTLPLRKFYKGYKSLEMKEGETIVKIAFDVPPKNGKFNFEKVSKRTHLDIASVNSAALFAVADDGKIEFANVSAGGVSPVPKFLEKTSEFLQNKILTTQTVREALEIAQTEIAPISDVRGSEEYKRKLLSRLIIAHFLKLFPQKIEAGELLS